MLINLRQGDSGDPSFYARAMESGQPHLFLKLDIDEPIELTDFVSAFTSLAAQYDKFIRLERPDLAPDATVYVREVRPGCIEADLIPWAQATVAAVAPHADQIITLAKFVTHYGLALRSYFKKGGRQEDASKSDLKDFTGQVAAVAKASRRGGSQLAAAYYRDGKREVEAAFIFSKPEAQTALEELQNHRYELEQTASVDKSRVLMRFVQSNLKDRQLGKRTGEIVLIEAVSPKELPLVYASDLAEQRIKHEVREADDNVFKKAFDVDVNVEMSGDRLIAYRLVHVHEVIDLPPED